MAKYAEMALWSPARGVGDAADAVVTVCGTGGRPSEEPAEQDEANSTVVAAAMTPFTGKPARTAPLRHQSGTHDNSM